MAIASGKLKRKMCVFFLEWGIQKGHSDCGKETVGGEEVPSPGSGRPSDMSAVWVVLRYLVL